MLYKDGAEYEGLQAPIWYALGVFEVLYAEKGHQLVLAVGTNGVHAVQNSLHAKGLAADLRTRTMPMSVAQLIIADAKKILFPLGFDVVDETTGGQPHIHVEYDPKPGRSSYVNKVVEV